MIKLIKSDIDFIMLFLGIFLAISFGELVSWAFRVWWDEDSYLFPAVHILIILACLILLFIFYEKKDKLEKLTPTETHQKT